MGELTLVTFVPAGRSAQVAPGTTLLKAAAEAGVVVPAPCGGRGACGRCAVSVVDGDLALPSQRETAALARARAAGSGMRLACLAEIGGPVTVRPLGGTTRLVSGGHAAERAELLVAGVDLGTTSVAVQLVDPVRRTVVGTARVPNRQASFGSDVLSRIAAAIGGDSDALAEAAGDSVADALTAAIESTGLAGVRVERIVLAGNTAMTSLLAGVEVTGLASHPFSHAMAGTTRLQRGSLADRYPGTEIVLVPPVAAFVGGDLVAGMIAEGLSDEAEGSLFVDLGTNAEVAAVTGGRCVVASAPAGPAFEGWGIACGGQAGAGGIVAMLPSESGGMSPILDGDRETHITGSGLISATALLLRTGHLDEAGLLHADGPAAERFFELDGVRAVTLCTDPRDREVFLTQLDVRALQSAKGAVCAAVKAVAREASLTGKRLAEIVLAGAFGGALETDDLVALGVVPIQSAGLLRYAPDAAARGAAAMALEPGLLEDARELMSGAVHVDLASGTTFADEFMACVRLAPYSL